MEYESLVELARTAGCSLTIVPALGEFVPAGAPLFEIDRGDDKLDHDEVTKGSPQVSRRLHAALTHLLTIAPPERTPVLRDQMERLERMAGETPVGRDAQEAVMDDLQGMGVAVGNG